MLEIQLIDTSDPILKKHVITAHVTLKGSWTSALLEAKDKVNSYYELEHICTDGKDLSEVCTQLKNIPYRLGVCYWYGDMAKFILFNLSIKVGQWTTE